MPTPCRRNDRRMGSTQILDLCRFVLFLHLVEFKYIALQFTFLLYAVLPSFALRLKALSPKSCAWYTLPSPAADVLYQLFSLWTKLPSPSRQHHVLLVFHLFVCFIPRDHIELPSQCFKHGRMELLKPVILSRVRWRLRKVYCSCVSSHLAALAVLSKNRFKRGAAEEAIQLNMTK